MYRAKAITQRDGSKLQNSNCRMASISTGLDFDTLGAKVSTGGKMRSYTTDQSGGTDSGDAKEAWTRGFHEALLVRDGNTWATALSDLRAGRLVHLDVWHATMGGGCVSGSGQYGHTVAVAPESSGTRWLVADPWCKPARWEWIESRKLQAASEEWGRRIRQQTGGEHDYPSRAIWALALAATAKLLMGLYHAGGDEDPTPDPAETGGPAVIMYTVTAAHPATPTPVPPQPGGNMTRFVSSGGYAVDSGMRLDTGAGQYWYYFDGVKGGSISKAASLTCFGLLDGVTDQFVCKITTAVPYADGKSRDTLVLIRTTNDPYKVPVPPTPEPPAGDCSDQVTQAVQDRDQEWEDWLLGGAPNQQTE